MNRHEPGSAMQTRTFLVDPETRRASDDPTRTAARLMWLFFRLVRNQKIDFITYDRAFQLSERTYKRDLARLRKAGPDCGFTVSRLRRGEVMLKLDPESPFDESREAARFARMLGDALGGPVAAELRLPVSQHQRDLPFLRVAAPRLVESAPALRVFRQLKAAAQRHARVTFQYVAAGRRRTWRTVEPYFAFLRSGRLYLLAYDPAPRKGWRRFALDGISEPIQRAGTFAPRAVPQVSLEFDAIGLFGENAPVAVTVGLSPAVAASATCRVWQSRQRTVEHDDGSAEITLTVSDPAEAVRWALGFGPEARVLAPPSVVAMARELVAVMARAYAASDVGSRTA